LIYYDEKRFKVRMKKVNRKGWKRRMYRGKNGEP
jgi:hypothetical protein